MINGLIDKSYDNTVQTIIQHAAPVQPGIRGRQETQIYGAEISRLSVDIFCAEHAKYQIMMRPYSTCALLSFVLFRCIGEFNVIAVSVEKNHIFNFTGFFRGLNTGCATYIYEHFAYKLRLGFG